MSEVTDRTKRFSGPFWEHMRAARREARSAWKELVPPSFREHQRAARREMLLACRSVIDQALERVEKPETPPVTRVKAQA